MIRRWRLMISRRACSKRTSSRSMPVRSTGLPQRAECASGWRCRDLPSRRARTTPLQVLAAHDQPMPMARRSRRSTVTRRYQRRWLAARSKIAVQHLDCAAVKRVPARRDA